MRSPMEGAEEQEQPSTSGKLIRTVQYPFGIVTFNGAGHMMNLLFKSACHMSHCMQNSARTFISEQLVWIAQQSICHLSGKSLQVSGTQTGNPKSVRFAAVGIICIRVRTSWA